MLDVEAMVRFYRALGFQMREEERIWSVHFGDQTDISQVLDGTIGG